jgi:hypothetical protein
MRCGNDPDALAAATDADRQAIDEFAEWLRVRAISNAPAPRDEADDDQ